MKGLPDGDRGTCRMRKDGTKIGLGWGWWGPDRGRFHLATIFLHPWLPVQLQVSIPCTVYMYHSSSCLYMGQTF